MLVEQQAAWALVRTVDDRERRWLTEYLTPPPKWSFGGTTAAASLYDPLARRFPRGLLYLVEAAAPVDGIEVKVLDGRVRPCAPAPEAADLSWLREDQRAAVDKFCAAGQGIVQVVTAGGKGEIAVGVAKAIPCRWLFLVHRAQLAQDVAERWARRTGEAAGFVGDGEWRVDQRFTCATFQTVVRALDDAQGTHHREAVNLLSSVGGVIADEAHVAGGAATFCRVLMACKAYFRLGLSANALDRGDGRNIHVVGAFGPTLVRASAEEMIEAGRVARPIVRMVPFHHAKVVEDPSAPDDDGLAPPQAAAGASYGEVYDKLVVEGEARNALLARICARAAKPALLFVRREPHGRTLTDTLGRAGLRVAFVNGKMPTEMRERVVKRLRRGDLDLAVCSVVFQEGVDCPELRAVVVGAAGSSKIAALQRVGRGMRLAEGKTTVEVWDVWDRGQRWLTRHAHARRTAYEKDGHAVDIRPLEAEAPAAGARGEPTAAPKEEHAP